MSRIRLREKSGPPILGTNMHIMHGHDRLRFVMKEYKPGLILDAACGEGVFSVVLNGKTDDNGNMLNEVWAIDILNSPIRYAENIHFEMMSVYDIPDSYPMFDTILFMEIVEHLEEPEKAIGILGKHLKPDGVMLITTPHIPTWDYEEDHIWRFDMDGVVGIATGMKTARLWQDDTFVYAKLMKQ